MQQEITAM